MKKLEILHILFLLFALINSVSAEEEPLVDKFLSNPLIVLVAIITVDIIALIYHKIKR